MFHGEEFPYTNKLTLVTAFFADFGKTLASSFTEQVRLWTSLAHNYKIDCPLIT